MRCWEISVLMRSFADYPPGYMIMAWRYGIGKSSGKGPRQTEGVGMDASFLVQLAMASKDKTFSLGGKPVGSE